MTLAALLHPGRYTRFAVVAAVLGLTTGSFLVGAGLTPLWLGSIIGFALAGAPWLLKWRRDLKVWGVTVTLLGVLVVLQGVHSLEHLVQLVQLYLLQWPLQRSQGLITSANVEWVHLTWNVVVLSGVIYLMTRGLRNIWMWGLLAWAGLHTLEHAYLFARYLQVAREMNGFGLPAFGASQSLPGVLGRDGWLSQQSWCGRIAGITTAPRAVIHFGWNAGEAALLLIAARTNLPRFSNNHASHTTPRGGNA
jgi:hypothetical protein